MRVWVDLTNSPHVLVMRPLIEAMRAQGHEVEVTARDFAQTLELCRALRHGAHGGRPPPRRQAGQQGPRPGLAQRRAGPLGAAAQVRRGHGPRLQRRDGRGRAAAHPQRDRVRLRVGEGPAQRELPAGQGGGGARRHPARAAGPLRRQGQAARLPGPEGGVLPGRLRGRPGRARRAGPGRLAADRGRAHAARRVALPPLREPAVRARAGPAGGDRADRGAAAHGRAARRARGPRRASSCPSTRSTRRA